MVIGLNLLGLSDAIRNVYASDKEPYCRKFLHENHKYELGVFKTIGDRPSVEAGVLDIYSAGFPCQPFSSQGRMEGFEDTQGRGVVGLEVVAKINAERPNTFLLENVASITYGKHRELFDVIVEGLSSITTVHGAPEYSVHHKILDTQDYGIPHSRNRVFIIGYKIDLAKIPWRWPTPISDFVKPASKLLGRPAKNPIEHTKSMNYTNLSCLTKALEAIRIKKMNVNKTIFIDIDVGKKRGVQFKQDVCPCITRSRAGCGGWWVTSLKRRMTTNEMLRFQGIPPGTLNFDSITERQFRMMIGNAWSVNVSARVTARLLLTIGLVRPSSLNFII